MTGIAKKLLKRIMLGFAVLILLFCGLPILVILDGQEASSAACPTSAAATVEPPAGQVTALGDWSKDQVANAAVIVAVGRQQGLPTRAWVIAVATAMQESSLTNLGYLGDRNDHDSQGLFQQRPSQGWGTVSQIRDPVYASTKFYAALKRVPRWETLPLTVAAQKVQRSAFPDAYAKWEDDAARLVAHVSGDPRASSDLGPGCFSTAAGTVDPAPRNSDGSWPKESCSIRPDPTSGRGCVTPRLFHLVQQASAAGYPEDPGCWDDRPSGEHPKGRACDWMMTSGGEAHGAEKAKGDSMAAWAVANADRLGLMYVIWYRRIWNPERGWHAYNTIAGNDPSGWHTNHVHVSVE